MKKANLLFILFAISLLSISNLYAQNKLWCGQYEAQQKYYQQHPELMKERAEYEKYVQEYTKNHKRDTKTTYVIPVVVHVIHSYGPENVSKASIQQMIDQLNKDYSATNSDLNNVITEFEGIIGNANIEFRLAKLDPDGNCTEGITRHYLPNVYSISSGSTLPHTMVPNWNPQKYLNVWTVHDIEGGVAAWSYVPPIAAYLDGLVMEYSWVGNDANHTIAHEIGHYLSLYHPWGQSNEPGVASNCNMDDYVDDTPNTIGAAFHCNLSFESCGSLDNVQNIMDYSNCPHMFTQGQVDRMQALLGSSTNGRNNLWTEANLIATGTNDGYSGNPCGPIADFIYDETNICQDAIVTFSNYSYNGQVTNLQWFFEGGNPATSSDSVVEVTYIEPGKHNVKLIASNEFGGDTILKTDAVNVFNTMAGFNLPSHEDFEDEQFPLNTEDSTKSWTIEAQGNITWQYTTVAAYTGSGSIRIKNNIVPDDYINSVITPNINLRDGNIDEISFMLAFAKKNDNSNGQLKIYISTNCGATWALRYLKSGNSLFTNGGEVVSGSFYPTDDEWRKEKINLIASDYDADHIMFKFENKSMDGNYMYIDDFMIDTVIIESAIMPVNTLKDVNIFPNPYTNSATLSFNTVNSDLVNFEVFNNVGKQLGSYKHNFSAGTHTIKIDEIARNLNNGVYLIKLSSNNGLFIKRFVKL